MRDPNSTRIEYGEWESDNDYPPIYVEGFHDPWVMRPQAGRYRRKRLESWTENGQLVGRWTWEYRFA